MRRNDKHERGANQDPTPEVTRRTAIKAALVTVAFSGTLVPRLLAIPNPRNVNFYLTVPDPEKKYKWCTWTVITAPKGPECPDVPDGAGGTRKLAINDKVCVKCGPNETKCLPIDTAIIATIKNPDTKKELCSFRMKVLPNATDPPICDDCADYVNLIRL